jgi:hypothetical protein
MLIELNVGWIESEWVEKDWLESGFANIRLVYNEAM